MSTEYDGIETICEECGRHVPCKYVSLSGKVLCDDCECDLFDEQGEDDEE